MDELQKAIDLLDSVKTSIRAAVQQLSVPATDNQKLRQLLDFKNQAAGLQQNLRSSITAFKAPK